MTNDDVNKHRANIIQIAGYGFMAPLGNIVLGIFSYDYFKFGYIFFLLYFFLHHGYFFIMI